MRALPLRVWKARRAVTSAARSAGCTCKPAKAWRALASTSCASSRKISRISASSSAKPAAPRGGTAAIGRAGAGAVTAAGWVATTGAGAGVAAGAKRPSAAASDGAAAAPPRSSIGKPWLPNRGSRGSAPSAWLAPRCRALACCTMRSNSSVTATASVSGRVCGPWSDWASAWAAVSLKPVARSCRAITADRLPLSASKRNSDLAICGCTLTMSIKKLSAPRLSASRLKLPLALACAASTSVLASVSTSSRMRSTACEAWSRPSTDSTPRMADNWPGTGISSARRAGSRKYWSMAFSISDSEARSSCTTLPMVWRSDTRRYSSSIHKSSVPGSRAWRTWSMRWARRCTRCAPSGCSKSPSSSEASMNSSAVATSIARSAGGSAPVAVVWAAATCSERPSTPPSGYRRASESATSANCSDRPDSRGRSPPATADQTSLAATTRLRACATQAGSNRPSLALS